MRQVAFAPGSFERSGQTTRRAAVLSEREPIAPIAPDWPVAATVSRDTGVKVSVRAPWHPDRDLSASVRSGTVRCYVVVRWRSIVGGTIKPRG